MEGLQCLSLRLLQLNNSRYCRLGTKESAQGLQCLILPSTFEIDLIWKLHTICEMSICSDVCQKVEKGNIIKNGIENKALVKIQSLGKYMWDISEAAVYFVPYQSQMFR